MSYDPDGTSSPWIWDHPRSIAWGGVTGVTIVAFAKLFARYGPRLGFGTLGLGAAANAVSMAVGIPYAVGYVASYAIDGSEGIDNYEHFLTHPEDMLVNTVMSAVNIHTYYSGLPGNSGEFNALEFEGVTPGVM